MKKIKVNDVELAYRDEGSGQPIVFLHAFPLNQTMRDEQIIAFASAYRVITFDWRGFGESGIGQANSIMPIFANDLAELLIHLRIKEAVICGLSMGGYAAFAFYRKYAAWVKALILCNTRAASDTEEAKRGRYEMAELARSKGLPAIAEKLIPRLLGETTLQSNSIVTDRVRTMIHAAQPEGVAQALLGMAERDDSTDLLPLITCPTLIVAGDEDKLTPLGETERMAGSIAPSHLKVISGAGHLSNLEQSMGFNQAIHEFLDQL